MSRGKEPPAWEAPTDQISQRAPSPEGRGRLTMRHKAAEQTSSSAWKGRGRKKRGGSWPPPQRRRLAPPAFDTKRPGHSRALRFCMYMCIDMYMFLVRGPGLLYCSGSEKRHSRSIWSRLVQTGSDMSVWFLLTTRARRWAPPRAAVTRWWPSTDPASSPSLQGATTARYPPGVRPEGRGRRE